MAMAQRKAWNDAMRSAGAVLPTHTTRTASSAAIDRRRKRRDGARKSSSMMYGDSADVGTGAGGASSFEEREYRAALRMDMLEGVVGDGAVSVDVDDEDYDEFAELDDDHDDEYGNDNDEDGEGKAKKKRKRKGAVGGGGGTGKNSSSSGVPKYLKPRSLASILMEEAGRSDSVAWQYANASIRRLGSGRMIITRNINSRNNAVITTTISPYPCRKFCPVTGLFGAYTDPKSGIPYATLSALEQIKERPPPWLNAGNNAGSASYWEAVKSLQSN